MTGHGKEGEAVKLEKGDHIYVWHVFYSHHGIYAGGGKAVHYLREGVALTSLEEFAGGGKIRVKRHLVKKDGDEILSRAYSRLGEDRYNLIFNNCEHFASWCATGIPVSFQAALAAAEIIILLRRGGI